ncbi:hypothetical protein ACFRFL_39425 [Streptomyces sp. NPDC056708]|uniref:hypothetical protein n=1 Tax=unclassified Streptomyces TaxID=2593676 RepID=UPI003686214C
MTVRARTRLDRVRASAGIAKLAFQQIEDDLTGEIGAQELAEILREQAAADLLPAPTGMAPSCGGAVLRRNTRRRARGAIGVGCWRGPVITA